MPIGSQPLFLRSAVFTVPPTCFVVLDSGPLLCDTLRRCLTIRSMTFMSNFDVGFYVNHRSNAILPGKMSGASILARLVDPD